MPETKGMNAGQVLTRAEQAHAFLNAGQVITQAWAKGADLYQEDAVASVIGSLAVLSGIASADAICGHALQRHSASGNHRDAVALVSTVDGGAARLLQALLDEKNNVQYSTVRTSLQKAQTLTGQAQQLYRLMLRLNRPPLR